MGIQIKLGSGRLAEAAVDVVVVTVVESGKNLPGLLQDSDQGTTLDDALDGLLSATIQREKISGKVGVTRLIPVADGISAKAVMLVGVGSPKTLTLQDLRVFGAKVGQVSSCARAKSVAAVLGRDTVNGCSPANRLRAMVEGVRMGTYRFTTYKTEVEPDTLKQVIVLASGNRAALEKAVHAGNVVSEATCLARDWVNTPPCDLVPAALATIAKDLAKQYKLKIEVLTGKALVNEDMRLLLAVGQGSVNPPAFIHLQYKPTKKSRRKIALVGKGITFDTGGLDLKPSASMITMKDDMGGAAAVLGAMQIIAQLKPDVTVDVYVATAENSIGSLAQRPSDVVKSRNGKTVEIANTDAEGRLVLADALDYAVERKPDVVVDVATLTGGIVVALGEQCVGIFSNREDQAEKMMAAADRAGELMWHMPLLKVYEGGLKSQVADLSSMGKSKASSVTAALFLKQFVKDTPWVHLDIAGAAWSTEMTTLSPIGGTGVAVRTLVEFCVG